MQKTIPSLFFATAEKYGSRQALGYKISGHFDGKISWNEWAEAVKLTALGLEAIGIKRGDKVGILSENCPGWTFADLGALTLGAVSVPMYPTLSSDDLAFIATNAELKALFVSSKEQYEKICGIARQKKIILICLSDFSAPDCCGIRALQDHGRALQSKVHSDWLEEKIKSVNSGDLATLIYTSGTTGTPKGVMLTHANFIENYLGSAERIRIDESDVALSFLPLSHVFERLAGYYFMAFSGAQIIYAESMQTVADDIKVVRPSVAAAVPRFYEKVYAGLQAKLKASPSKQRLFAKALACRKKIRNGIRSGHAPGLTEKICDAIFDKLVFSKVRAAIGGRIRFFISGGAPLSRELAEFFDLCGILILEGYGLTETSPVIAVNTEAEHRFGTVGKPLNNIQVKIGENGEILTAGPCVMQGYYRNPEATSEVLRDGWFHTGDIGEFDSDGYLKITDRIKDLIVTAGGKKVAPQKLEALVLRDSLFSQVIALGDKKPYIVALLVLNRALAEEGFSACQLRGLSYEEAIKEPVFYKWVSERLQKQLEGVARFESIKTFAILPQEFTIQSGELTPTLKIKRRFVMEKYQSVLEGLYKLSEAHRDN